jgi:hypothetical protein
LSIVYTVLSIIIIIIIIIVVVVIFYMHTAACRISFWILLLHPVFDIEGLSKPFKFIQEFDSIRFDSIQSLHGSVDSSSLQKKRPFDYKVKVIRLSFFGWERNIATTVNAPAASTKRSRRWLTHRLVPPISQKIRM